MFDNIDFEMFNKALYETIYMSLLSTVFVFIFGLILGILLFATDEKGLVPNRIIYNCLSVFTSLFRSIPFLILIVLLIPFTKIIIGTILGPSAALPALIIGATPFYARLVELSLNEKGEHLVETGRAFGASNFQIITRVLLKESLPGIVRGITVTAILITGYTSIAGAIGAGGLGNLAYLYGFARNRMDITVLATIEIIVIILLLQFTGDRIVKKLNKT